MILSWVAKFLVLARWAPILKSLRTPGLRDLINFAKSTSCVRAYNDVR